jgi:hypothetical protein
MAIPPAFAALTGTVAINARGVIPHRSGPHMHRRDDGRIDRRGTVGPTAVRVHIQGIDSETDWRCGIEPFVDDFIAGPPTRPER